MTEIKNVTKKRFFHVGQDWATVIVGFVLIFTVLLAGYNIKVPSFGDKTGWHDFATFLASFSSGSFYISVLGTFLLFLVIAIIGLVFTGEKPGKFFLGFTFIFILALIAQLLSSYLPFKNLGLETVLFSLAIGLFIGHIGNLRQWLIGGAQTELFVKVGLVLLGATILFSDLLVAGSFGLIQSVIVVFCVWNFAFWISRKLKVDDEYATILSSAVSICGVSAAIATSGAINGDKKKLSVIISLVLIVAIPMMIFMPILAKWLGLSDEVTGAWLGGTIDTTGAVVGAGTIVGEIGLKYATIVKFSQNVLLGIAAFAISVFWAYRKHNGEGKRERVPLRVIWERFPKFVVGFMAASLLFSFFVDKELASGSGKLIKSFSGFWFNLAFISIGIETRFSDLKSAENKKPIYSFLIAQGFNIIFTLLVSYFLFKVMAQ
jgi:uncharacterized integral membrane protein (TIGR00698 family)